jgi:hypothetical protein
MGLGEGGRKRAWSCGTSSASHPTLIASAIGWLVSCKMAEILIFGPLIGFVFGLCYWLLLGFFRGVASTTIDDQLRVVPNQSIRHSAFNALRYGLIVALLVGLEGRLLSTWPQTCYPFPRMLRDESPGMTPESISSPMPFLSRRAILSPCSAEGRECLAWGIHVLCRFTTDDRLQGFDISRTHVFVET